MDSLTVVRRYSSSLSALQHDAIASLKSLPLSMFLPICWKIFINWLICYIIENNGQSGGKGNSGNGSAVGN